VSTVVYLDVIEKDLKKLYKNLLLKFLDRIENYLATFSIGSLLCGLSWNLSSMIGLLILLLALNNGNVDGWSSPYIAPAAGNSYSNAIKSAHQP